MNLIFFNGSLISANEQLEAQQIFGMLLMDWWSAVHHLVPDQNHFQGDQCSEHWMLSYS